MCSTSNVVSACSRPPSSDAPLKEASAPAPSKRRNVWRRTRPMPEQGRSCRILLFGHSRQHGFEPYSVRGGSGHHRRMREPGASPMDMIRQALAWLARASTIGFAEWHDSARRIAAPAPRSKAEREKCAAGRGRPHMDKMKRIGDLRSIRHFDDDAVLHQSRVQ